MTTQSIPILLVDDHSVVRDGLRLLLEGTGKFACHEAQSAEEALQMVLLNPSFQVVLLDISLPGLSGLEALPHFQRLRPELAIIILSMHGEELYSLRCLRSGAKGYINKSSSSADIIKAVEHAADGKSLLSLKMVSRLSDQSQTDISNPLHESLSNQEFKILLALGQGKTVTEVSKEQGLSVKTVSTYRERIFRKMKFEKNMDMVSYVVREGLFS